MSTNKSRRPFVIAAVMASIAMVAVEATIISTAMPHIVSSLGGLYLYSWVFSSFLLAQTAMTVVFGKLADSFGRKRVILVGIAIFLLGSLLSGLAWTMPALIAFRVIQGIGAGAIQPVTLTIVGDLYPANERGKIQGYLASVWAVAAVIGPMAGAMIIHSLSWAWVFWINIPIGLMAAAGFALFLHEEKKHDHPSIDFIGAVLFAVAVSALMVVLTSAATDHTRTFIALGILLVSAALFLVQERRAADPMISLQMWTRRVIAATNGATLFSGMALMGLTSFLPMYVQGVLHQTPVVAGFALTMVMVGWPTGATIAARLFNTLGLRRILVTGSAIVPIGAIAFVMLTPHSSPLFAALGSLIVGFGMGAVSVSSLVLIQESVDLSQRGSATASNLFSRNLGNTLGATLFGALMNYGLAHDGKVGAVTSDQLRRLIEVSAHESPNFDAIRLALHHSMHVTFVGIFVVSVGIAVVAAFIPKVASARRTKQVQQPAWLARPSRHSNF